MSTRIRQFVLKAARRAGIRNFKATSQAGHDYICHVGDFSGENPFYNPSGDQLGLSLMSAWCCQQENPVVYDVGANLGFVCTQLAQIIRAGGREPLIVAFEPVWSTFSKLRYSIAALGLQAEIVPVCAAISDQPGFASIVFDEKQSLYAQLSRDTSNPRTGSETSFVPIQTLDLAAKTFPPPTLLKVDVEGFEAHVIRGCPGLLSAADPPAIFMEINPVTMGEVGSSPDEVSRVLEGWSFFYVDDFEGQKMPFGKRLDDFAGIGWVCNIFAVPPGEVSMARWQVASRDLQAG